MLYFLINAELMFWKHTVTKVKSKYVNSLCKVAMKKKERERERDHNLYIT